MKKHKIKMSKMKLQEHPQIIELTKLDVASPSVTPDIRKLSEAQLLILLENIQLNVISIADCEYLLLAPNAMYFLLEHHPAIKKMNVNLLIHSPCDEAELILLIDTLNLVYPSLSVQEFDSKSKTIHRRYKRFKNMGYKPTNLTLLANFAGKTKSTLRS